MNNDCPVCKNDLNGCLGKVTERTGAGGNRAAGSRDGEIQRQYRHDYLPGDRSCGCWRAGLLLQDRAPETAGGYGRDEFEDDGYGEDYEQDLAYSDESSYDEDEEPTKDGR